MSATSARVKFDTTGRGVSFGVGFGLGVGSGLGVGVDGDCVGAGVIELSSGGGVSPSALAMIVQAATEFPLCKQFAYVSVEEVLPRLQSAKATLSTMSERARPLLPVFACTVPGFNRFLFASVAAVLRAPVPSLALVVINAARNIQPDNYVLRTMRLRFARRVEQWRKRCLSDYARSGSGKRRGDPKSQGSRRKSRSEQPTEQHEIALPGYIFYRRVRRVNKPLTWALCETSVGRGIDTQKVGHVRLAS